jgi:hypothetical protein
VSPGDVVRHIRTGERLFVEEVDGRSAYVAWYADGELVRRWFGVAWLVPEGMALA